MLARFRTILGRPLAVVLESRLYVYANDSRTVVESCLNRACIILFVYVGDCMNPPNMRRRALARIFFETPVRNILQLSIALVSLFRMRYYYR